ncbi:MAG: hypothetical protein IID45_13255, partial [Planctomycetes bacterium]|nr:hypothetical protein [Planctomycetota bacterium]
VGTLDTHTVLIDWGTGETSSVAVVTQGAGSGTFTATHQYLDDNPTATASDVYSITATVTDDDGGFVTSAASTLTVNNVAPNILSVRATDVTALAKRRSRVLFRTSVCATRTRSGLSGEMARRR